MAISFIRATIIYILVVISVRIMGKRQIGELKPHELVITVLVSQIATIPIEDNSMPLLNSVVPLMALIAFEIFASVISMKSLWFRNTLQGRPIIVIRDGRIDQKQLKRLRFTVDDLVDALRTKDIFDVNDVAYAVIETNGTISVMPKESRRCVNLDDLNIPAKRNTMPMIVVIDGKPVSEYFGGYPVSVDDVYKELKKRHLNIGQVMYMSRDNDKKYTVICKEK